MASRIRRKRASPTDLYKTCVAGGDCIPDVKNKIEGTTWADTFLKIFGSLVYFGGLGIGTGKGSGGSLGYRPLGSANGPRITSTGPVRPAVTVDPLGPSDVLPIGPESSAIIPLSEGAPDIGFVAPDAGPGLGIEEIELYTIKPTTDDVGPIGGTPGIVSSEDGATAVINIEPINTRPTQVFYDPPAPPTHEINVFQTNPMNSTDINVFVDPQFSGTDIGAYEEIPLARLDFSELEIEEPPITSTPIQRLEPYLNRARDLYHRFTKQVPVTHPDFLGQPSRLVQFEFENPAFSDDVTIEFERDLAEVTAAPHADFADVIRLGRPRFSQTSEGGVRVSRLGELGTITTRSGTTIGPKVHFYMDLSNIEDVETIELQTMGEHSGTNTIVDNLLATSIIDPINTADAAVNESDLLDTFSEDFNNAHIILTMTDELESVITIPTLPPGGVLKIFVDDIANGIVVSHPSETDSSVDILLPNSIPLGPSYYLDVFEDFNLHPAFLPRKRRRMNLF
uniref:Minor capsid protein L2 n=1 Tax=Human papillomavirus TaxID=10566 RepID=A0A385PMF9_9PAPI|nr:MAG: L2 protein [Human papillomavirus]